jgi:hypothetical protein
MTTDNHPTTAAEDGGQDDIGANPVVTTYRLPTTGYVVLHTWQRDGEPPQDATVFIDAAGVLDDATATARVQAELARLHQQAPGNVMHTLRLVHRTGDGDREIFTGAPVRGSAPARP